jgi:hypothetical protein
MEARDHDAVVATLAPDVVLISPIFGVPFEGREQASELFAVILEIFDELSYKTEIAGDPHVLNFTARINGEEIEGIDLLRFNDAGEISEIRVFFRPLRGIAAFMDAAAPKLGRRLKGGGTATVLRVLGGPPSLMMRSVAGLGPRILGLRKRES